MSLYNSLEDVLKSLRLSKASYYRKLKSGELLQEKINNGGNTFYKVDFSNPSLSEGLSARDDKLLMDQWIQWREQGIHIRPWSESYKRLQLGYINLYFERWRNISPSHLETWLKETPRTQKTLRTHKHSCVSSFAKFLHSKGVLADEELIRIKALYPKKDPYYEPHQKIICEEDLKPILDAVADCCAGDAYQAILYTSALIFLLETGLRSAELCGLKLSSLHFSDDPAKAFIRAKGKGGKIRNVPFSRKAQAAIREYLKVRPADKLSTDPLFWAYSNTYKFTPLVENCLRHRIIQFREKSGVSFSAHSLRHYRITKWANNPRIPITTTQLWAGHESLSVTQRYIHLTDEEALRAAYE